MNKFIVLGQQRLEQRGVIHERNTRDKFHEASRFAELLERDPKLVNKVFIRL